MQKFNLEATKHTNYTIKDTNHHFSLMVYHYKSERRCSRSRIARTFSADNTQIQFSLQNMHFRDASKHDHK